MQTKPERRKSTRVSWTGRVKITEIVTHKVVSTNSRVRNLGLRGFAFVTEDAVKRGVRYRFDFDLGTSRISLDGQLVHHRVEATYAVCGARFASVPFLQRSRLNHFVSGRSPKLHASFVTRSVLVSAIIGSGTFLSGQSIPISIAALLGSYLTLSALLPY